MTKHNEIMDMKEKEKNCNNIIKNILDSIDGKDYETICMAFCFTLATHIHYFVKKEMIEEFLDNFKTGTLKALNDLEEDMKDSRDTLH